MMNEELGSVRAFVDPRDGEDREPRRATSYPIDKLGVFPALLDFGHPALGQTRERLGDDAAGSHWIGFTDPQMCCQVVGVPALTERGCMRPDLVEQVAQLSPFGLRKRHERPS